jgi:hypothetical protein
MASKITIPVRDEGGRLFAFPTVEEVDAKPVATGGYEVILVIKIEGEPIPVTIRLTKEQSRDLSRLLKEEK